MRDLGFAALALWLFANTCNAQIISGNVFAGYSYLNSEYPENRASLNGWNAAVEARLMPHLGIVADFSGQYGSPDLAVFYPCPSTDSSFCPQPENPQEVRTSVQQYNFLFGPRLSFRLKRFRPFAEVIVGASHYHQTTSHVSVSDTAFAYAIGGGVDYRLIRLLEWRIQLDALQTRFFSSSQTDLRASTGLVVHF
jgi:hypothetical protein